jgi:hypothetical protein
MGGVKLTELSPITLADKEQLFGAVGEGAKKITGWPLTTIKKHELAVWMVFLNQRLFLASQPENGDDEAVAACLAAWRGSQLDWSDVVYRRIKVELQAKKKRNPLILVSATLISAICLAEYFTQSTRQKEPLSTYTVPLEPAVKLPQ